MASGRKFAALGQIKRQQQPATGRDEEPPAHTTAVVAVERGRGRPPGKRSDPDFEPTTVLLRTATKRTAVRRLEDSNSKKDLSDLIEELLTEWSGRA